jgi:endonuclease/exonuclease/phosphatase family metal-dependent hydrolase
VVEVAGARHHFLDEPHPLIDVRYGATEPGHREPRCVVGGAFPSATGEPPVIVATTHLTYIGRAQRRAQAGAAASVLREVAGPHDPAILTGDFNAPVGAPELAALGDGFVDAFAAVGLDGDDPARQSCDRWPIDHVRVRGLQILGCRVATEAGDASDHWPVVADLRRAALPPRWR